MTPKIKRPRGRPPNPTKSLPPVGRLLRELRGEQSLATAAARLGKIGQWWQDREVGKVQVNARDMAAITKAYGVEWRCVDGVHRIIEAGE